MFKKLLTEKLVLCLPQPCFSDKTDNLEAYVKWFNRLCYLVATEICMVRRKPGAWPGTAKGGRVWKEPTGREPEGLLSPCISKPRARLSIPPGHPVSPSLPAVTFAPWVEPGRDPWPLTRVSETAC